MNKISRALVLGLLLLLSTGAALAQSASTILKQARTAIASDPATRVELQSTYSDARHAGANATKATLLLQDGKFRLEYDQITAVFAAGTLTYYDASSHTLYISEPTEEELLQMNPLLFLSSSEKHYSISTLPQTKAGSVLRFTPRDKRSNIKSLDVDFSRQSSLPTSILVLGKQDQSRLSVSIRSIMPTTKQDPSRFVLTAKQFPGCEVVDLR